MILIETGRLRLRNFDVKDWQDLQEMIVKYQESAYARYDHPWPTSAEAIKNAVAWFADGDSYLAVCLRATGRLIGLMAIDQRQGQKERVHNLGYIFHPEYQGQGYGTESCRAAIDHLFGEIGADRILTGTHPDNQPSVWLLKKLGLKEIAPGEFAISRAEWFAQEA
jgi:RimJ/RimL family protein N-acetyltransferase